MKTKRGEEFDGIINLVSFNIVLCILRELFKSDVMESFDFF